MNTKTILAAGSTVVLAVLLAACGGGGDASSSRTISPSESAAIATAKAAAQDYVGRCIPLHGSGLAQLNFGRSLLTSTGRQNFATCLAIPKANRKAFEGDLLTAAEHVKWTDKGQRHTAFFVTLPALAKKYHDTPAPGAPATPSGTVTVTVKPSATVTK